MARQPPLSEFGCSLTVFPRGEGQFGGKTAPDVSFHGGGSRLWRGRCRGRGAERPPRGRSAGNARRAAGERNLQLRSEPVGRSDHPARRSRSRNKADPAADRRENADNPAAVHSRRQPGGQTEIAELETSAARAPIVATQQRPSKLSCGSRIRISVRPKRGTPR